MSLAPAVDPWAGEKTPELAASIRAACVQRVRHPLRLRYVVDAAFMPVYDVCERLVREGLLHKNRTGHYTALYGPEPEGGGSELCRG